MKKYHNYSTHVSWTGNKGSGTSSYLDFERSHTISIENKPDILGSSDPVFRGDKTKHNPEDFLVASISSCHMLWYLHLCSEARIIVVDYRDHADGTMTERSNGSGQFSEVTLRPIVIVMEKSMADKAYELHQKANEMCFIANSVNFKVKHQPIIKVYK
ncbi:OsmC family protein [Reichenbachiella versicolor]|uniref:OsmC family protein n=1 Tax=Reichenbachiella versicolor TaxID=1821036 RepID=UPI000D6DE52A|nr:OsmC family protein [Reichenbachiella versicolor]